jgi:hypothetical protein
MTVPRPGHEGAELPMPDQQPIPHEKDHAAIELSIVYLLTDPGDNQPLWALEDLARELREPEIINYVRRLQEAGLIHCTSNSHVFASRAAVRQVQLVGHNVG